MTRLLGGAEGVRPRPYPLCDPVRKVRRTGTRQPGRVTPPPVMSVVSWLPTRTWSSLRDGYPPCLPRTLSSSRSSLPTLFVSLPSSVYGTPSSRTSSSSVPFASVSSLIRHLSGLTPTHGSQVPLPTRDPVTKTGTSGRSDPGSVETQNRSEKRGKEGETRVRSGRV